MPPLKWVRTCVICKTSYGRSDDGKRKFMTKFPLDYNRCREWVKVIGVPKLALMSIEKLHNQKYVCGDHFEDKYFSKKKTRLSKLAMPTLHIKTKPLTEDVLTHFTNKSSSTIISSTKTHDQPSVTPGRSSRVALENPGSALYAPGTKMKVEKQVCRGCLSIGRRCLITDVSFIKCFVEFHRNEDDDSYTIMLCWECRALIRKILEFQKRVQVAGGFLQQYSANNSVTQSTLVSVYKDTYDLIINENQNNDKQKIKVEKLKDNDGIYNDNTFNDHSDEFDGNDDESNDNDDGFNDTSDELNDKSDVLIDNDDELNDKSVVLKHKSNEFNDTSDVLNDKSNVSNDNEKKIKRKKKRYVVKKCKNYTIYRVDPKKYKNYMIEYHIRSEDLKIYHKKEIKYDGYKCMVCGMELCSLDEYQSHITKHNTQAEMNEFSKEDKVLQFEEQRVLFKCNLCKCDSANERMFELHFLEHKTLYKCNHCKVQFDSEAAVSNHFTEMHSKCICDYCGNEYRTKGRLTQHMEHHKKQECNICKRNFTTRDHLGRHKLNVHGIYKWKPKPKPEETYCVECDKNFVSMHALRKHLYSSVKHGGYKQKSVACSECGKVFARMSYMKNHYRLYHSEETKFRCDLCGKRFVTAFSLKQHGQLVHEKIQRPKDKICESCGRGFATNRTLIQHVRIHTGERPYPCPLCPARFRQKYSAQIHFRSQHANKNLMPS